MNKPYEEDDDDGETVANMNVEGMPWYEPERKAPIDPKEHYQLSPTEFKMYRWAALKAALLVAGVFALCFFLFLLFADFVWLR